jgi:integrase
VKPHSANKFIPRARRVVGAAFRFHDLRHTFATRLAGVAQRPRLVQYLLGHHATTPTEKYDHPTQEETRAAIQAMDAANQKGETP